MKEKEAVSQAKRVEVKGKEEIYNLKESLYYHLRMGNIVGWSVFPFDGSKKPTRGFLFYPDEANLFEFPKFKAEGLNLAITLDRLTEIKLDNLPWFERSEDMIVHPNDARIMVHRFTFPLSEQFGATMSFVRLSPD